MSRRQKVMVIVGPTSSGKSALGVELARKFNGEVISADSRQVYRGLTIGTGKITKREMRGVPHHLLDVASPKRSFTAHDFAARAEHAMKEILAKERLPIVVGGTGFYIDGLFGRFAFPIVPPDKALRARLSKKSSEQLYELLKKRDPNRARSMNTPSERNNKLRLIRALEIASAHTKGSPLQVPLHTKGSPLYDVLWVGIMPNQKILAKKIEKRLQARIRQGMIAEAKRLHKDGLSYKRMESLGLEYRSLSRLLRGKISRAEFEQELLRDICRYAKKQLLYWKRNHEIRWYDPKQQKTIERAVAAWLKLR